MIYLPKITINPGHGKKNNGTIDPGAIGAGGLNEYIQADQVGVILKDLFLAEGWEVQYLQDGDLWDVSEGSDAWKADYFISVHCNAVADRSAHGIETCYQAAGGLAEEIAKSVQAELVAATGLTDRGAKIKNLHVTRETNAPAILVEAGFISNPAEESLMNQTSFDNLVAKAIYDGFMKATGYYKESKGEKTMKNLILCNPGPDERAAGYLADHLKAPVDHLSSVATDTLAAAQNVYVVGSMAKPTANAVCITGTDRYDTCRKILDICQGR
ncbi:N-acetylmuramoyl-L-alanine amidase [Dehalobacter restrictus]|uniref:N-acetylmuramoyl-L-alanine amidase family protein n=1 Tax=Dehalobacter restrictus TaxID=55583 RepID=UPI00338D6A32